MIGILIKNNEKTLFTGLPKETEKLEKQLAGIGLNVPLQEVNLSNHNDIGYELEIYAQSQIDMEVASRIILHDNIGQLNDLMLYISQGDSDKMNDRICESHAETISDLYSELTTPPEIETTDKLVIRTTMNYKANFYEPADCIVEKAIAIPHEEYSALINITDNCYDFIADNQECMYYDRLAELKYSHCTYNDVNQKSELLKSLIDNRNQLNTLDIGLLRSCVKRITVSHSCVIEAEFTNGVIIKNETERSDDNGSGSKCKDNPCQATSN